MMETGNGLEDVRIDIGNHDNDEDEGDDREETSQQDAEREERRMLGVVSDSHRYASSTVAIYKSKVNNLKKFLSQCYPHLLTEENGAEEVLLPLDEEIFIEFFNHIQLKSLPKQGGGGFIYTNQKNEYEYNSYNHVSSHKDAFKALYRDVDLEFPKSLNDRIAEKLKGYKRLVADKKSKGTMKAKEGKDPLNIAGVKFLVMVALGAITDFFLSIQCHCYLLLCWNLIARSSTTADITYESVGWVGDHLTLLIEKMKNDQTGERGFARAVYANPLNPSICPILSLAVLVFVKGYDQEDTRRLFGDGFADRFTRWLCKVLKDNAEALLGLGLVVTELGTHSLRKGVASMVSSFPGGPDAVSIWLRAGWSLGDVAKRYIFAASGGDEYVGRCAAMLSMHDEFFGCLPPHFNPADGPVLSPDEWESILPGYMLMPNGFRSAVPFLLASLVYHQDFLEETLPSNHPLFTKAVWTEGYVHKLKGKTLSGVMENTVSGMTATGIPPHIMLQRGLREVKRGQEKLSEQIKHVSVTFQETASNVITEMKQGFAELPKNVAMSVLKNCEVTGAVGVTHDQVLDIADKKFEALGEMVEAKMARFQEQLTSFIESSSSAQQQQQQGQSSQLPSPGEDPSNFDPQGFRRFQWSDGTYHMIDENFDLPITDAMGWWGLWYGGVPAKKIRSYDQLSQRDLPKGYNL